MTTDPSLQRPDAEGTLRVPLEGLRRRVATARGTARGGFDVADGACRHAARQIVCALADGAAADPEVRSLLRELAVQSERLIDEAVVLHSRLGAGDRAAQEVVESGGDDAIAEVLVELRFIHADAVTMKSAADGLRRRLPREYGDPLGLDCDWPSAGTREGS